MMMLAGTQQDMYGQRQADAARELYYETQSQPYDEIQRAASLAMGFGGMGGTQKSKEGGGGGGILGTAGGILQTLAPLMMFAL